MNMADDVEGEESSDIDASNNVKVCNDNHEDDDDDSIDEYVILDCASMSKSKSIQSTDVRRADNISFPIVDCQSSSRPSGQYKGRTSIKTGGKIRSHTSIQSRGQWFVGRSGKTYGHASDVSSLRQPGQSIGQCSDQSSGQSSGWSRSQSSCQSSGQLSNKSSGQSSGWSRSQSSGQFNSRTRLLDSSGQSSEQPRGQTRGLSKGESSCNFTGDIEEIASSLRPVQRGRARSPACLCGGVCANNDAGKRRVGGDRVSDGVAGVGISGDGGGGVRGGGGGARGDVRVGGSEGSDGVDDGVRGSGGGAGSITDGSGICSVSGGGVTPISNDPNTMIVGDGEGGKMISDTGMKITLRPQQVNIGQSSREIDDSSLTGDEELVNNTCSDRYITPIHTLATRDDNVHATTCNLDEECDQAITDVELAMATLPMPGDGGCAIESSVYGALMAGGDYLSGRSGRPRGYSPVGKSSIGGSSNSSSSSSNSSSSVRCNSSSGGVSSSSSSNSGSSSAKCNSSVSSSSSSSSSSSGSSSAKYNSNVSSINPVVAKITAEMSGVDFGTYELIPRTSPVCYAIADEMEEQRDLGCCSSRSVGNFDVSEALLSSWSMEDGTVDVPVHIASTQLYRGDIADDIGGENSEDYNYVNYSGDEEKEVESKAIRTRTSDCDIDKGYHIVVIDDEDRKDYQITGIGGLNEEKKLQSSNNAELKLDREQTEVGGTIINKTQNTITSELTFDKEPMEDVDGDRQKVPDPKRTNKELKLGRGLPEDICEDKEQVQSSTFEEIKLSEVSTVEHRGIEGVKLDDLAAYTANSLTHQEGEDSVRAYDLWALRGDYDQILNHVVYRGPWLAGEEVLMCLNRRASDVATAMMKNSPSSSTFTSTSAPHCGGDTPAVDDVYVSASLADLDFSDIQVLDVAAGTGLVCQQLRARGLRNIDGLDPSGEMLQVARDKQIYRKLYHVPVPDVSESISDNAYDCVVTSGGMGEGHIPLCGLDDIIRMTKPGGILVIVMRSEYLDYVLEYKEKLRPKLSRFIEQGVIRPVNPELKIGEKKVHNYSFNKDGSIFSFYKL